MGITFKVEHEPEFTVEQLAMQLAEALQGAFNSKKDAMSFTEQMQVEGRKIADLEFTVRQVEHHLKNPPKEKTSRMDPLDTYDLGAIQDQIQEAKERRKDWAQRNSDALQKATELDARAAVIQGEIAQRRATG